MQIQGIGDNATWAGLVELHTQGHSTRFCARMIDLTSLVSGVGLAILIPVAAYNRDFLSLWVGSRQYAGDWVTVIACVNAWLWSITSLWGWPISGAGYIAAWTPYALSFALINIGISIGATRLAGSAGPLIGTLAAFLLVHTWAMPQVLRQKFGEGLGQIWRPALEHLFWAVPFAIAIWLMPDRQTTGTWLSLALEGGGTSLLGLALCWFGLTSGLRAELRRHLKFA